MSIKNIVQRSPSDRRCGSDRRTQSNPAYLGNGESENRKSMERRWLTNEKRMDWKRDTQWSSASQ